MPEQTEIDLKCVHEVMAHFDHCYRERTREHVLMAILEQLPLVRVMDEPGGEEACLRAIGWGDPPTSSIAKTILQILRELSNNLPERREQIVQEALRQIRAPREERAKAKRVRRARFDPIMRRAIRALAPRERAILRVMHELENAKHNLNADFGWGLLIENASMKSLREDPALRELMGVFNEAHWVNATAGK